MTTVTVYTKDDCGFCYQTKRLLTTEDLLKQELTKIGSTAL